MLIIGNKVVNSFDNTVNYKFTICRQMRKTVFLINSEKSSKKNTFNFH